MKKNLLFVLILAFIVIVFWIVSSVQGILNKSTIDTKTASQISPIQPSFDTQTIAKLKQRQNVQPLFLSSSGASQVTPSPSVAPSSSVQPVVSPTIPSGGVSSP